MLKGATQGNLYQVARPKIPQQALMNAQKSIKSMRTTANKSNSSLPAAMQKMTIQKRPQGAPANSTFVKSRDSSQTIQRHGIGGAMLGPGSLSQTTLEYNNQPRNNDQTLDTKSFRSMKPTALANNSINTAAKHHLQTSAKVKTGAR